MALEGGECRGGAYRVGEGGVGKRPCGGLRVRGACGVVGVESGVGQRVVALRGERRRRVD